MSEQKIKVGITQGDINGIGLEVIIKVFSDPLMPDICTPILFGSYKTYSFHKKAISNSHEKNHAEVRVQQIRSAEMAQSRQFNIVNIYEEDAKVNFGNTESAAGKYALMSIHAACEALEQKKIDVLVTAPINKHTIQSPEFQFKGHTGYLASRFKGDALMLMCADKLKVGVVTEHIPLADVASLITPELIIQKVKALNKTLVEDFGIRKPKIAVLGLNPHAGDNGTIGGEEQSVIIPALAKAKAENILVYGPYSADGFFGSNASFKFDGVLAMYHDQGLIPFKALAFSSGVNYTGGLPIIRTSPDHGVAYDIAGKNIADESSFRNAVYLACDIFKTRNLYKKITVNPLKSSSEFQRETN